MDQLTADCINFMYIIYTTGILRYVLISESFIKETVKTMVSTIGG